MTRRAAPIRLVQTLAIGLALTLSACTRAITPAPAADTQVAEPPPPPPLLGEAPSSGAKPADETGLLGGPPAPGAEGGAAASATMRYRRADGVIVSTMETIPDPEPAAAEPQAGAKPRPRVQGRVNRSGDMTVRAAPAPVVTPAAAPVTAKAPVSPAAPPPAPTQMAEAPKAAFIETLPLAAPTDPALASLQGAVAGEDASGARLAVADSISRGQAGDVELRFPASLLTRLQAEAAKLGLSPAARSAEVTARLSGQGFAIDPPGPQTLPLKADEDIVFNWRVVPDEGVAHSPIRAQADVALTGDGAAKSFAAAALEQPAAAPSAPPERTLTRGQTHAKWALALILVLLAVLVLTGVWRNHKERRKAEAERRQRLRAAQAFEDTPATPAPKTE